MAQPGTTRTGDCATDIASFISAVRRAHPFVEEIEGSYSNKSGLTLNGPDPDKMRYQRYGCTDSHIPNMVYYNLYVTERKDGGPDRVTDAAFTVSLFQ